MSRKHQDETRFIFHGNAMPFGGRIEAVNREPHHELIKGPPAAALPVVGGWSIATSSGSCCHPCFKWGATLADCKGERIGDRHFRTTVMSSIADVSARNDPFEFVASQIKIRSVSNHYAPGEEPHIVPLEIVFEGLALDKKPITVNFNNDFANLPTLSDFEKEYQTNRHFFNKYQVSLQHPSRGAGFGDRLPRTIGGYVATSFVASLDWGGKLIPGNKLSLEGFGDIYFGEVLLSADNRRFTMVRLDMGCAIQAVSVFSEVDHNGNY